MKRLTIPIQLNLCNQSDDSRLESAIVKTALAHSSTVNLSLSTGYEDNQQSYININIDSQNVADIWACIYPEIVEDNDLSSCVIAACEGDRGWDDYL